MIKTSADPKLVLTHPVHFVAFGFGSGLSPVAPGTVGSLVGFPLYYVMSGLPMLTQAVILAVLFLVGIWICAVTGKAVGEADHPGIVWDEIACFAMVLAITPMTPIWWAGAFAAFRFFDIVKIWPASWVDNNLKNGFGVMLDDLVAAMYAILVIVGFRYFLNV
ncbi:MAG: phosphatidylglycerophosphatase A [Sulfuriferula multivorans]|uniref:Phosphatidylglycerophosphatase A n=1 Tax=Sulfuriferula multivorans TaxID=1559896 RepID=A0A7C9JZU1_9PROT|nr:phosphatidylglycerophosphatase A [Sulfuriferula multivorans]